MLDHGKQVPQKGGIFMFQQKRAYEMRISDWSSDVYSSDLIVGDEPFAVFLPDEWMVGTPGFMKQMCDAYAQVGDNVIGALEVAPEETDKYGIISPGARQGRLVEVTALERGRAPWREEVCQHV